MPSTPTFELIRPWASVLAAVILLLSVLVVAPASAVTGVVWVGPGGSDATGTGTRVNPYRTIAEGLDHLVPGDTLNVLPGTYGEAYSEAFPLEPSDDGIWIRGIGPGKPKVLGADQDSVFKLWDNSVRVSGLEVTGGGSDGPEKYGGAFSIAVSNDSDVVTIEDCWIHDNETASNGAGGGISANGSVYPPGAGELTARRCLIEGNTSHNGGGGIYSNTVREVTIEDCVVRGNHADSDNAFGGAVNVARASVLAISDCELSGNRGGSTAGGGVGGLYISRSSGTVRNVEVTSNSSFSSGCAAEFNQSDLDVHNGTFARNYVSPANPGASVAVVCSGDGTQRVTMHSCIVNGNSPAAVNGVGLTFDTLCTDDPAKTSPPYIKSDPQFVHASDEGPNFRVLRTSPCVDAGSLSPLGSTDLDGRPRVSDGDGDGDARADLGSYEILEGKTRRLYGGDRYLTACSIWANTLTEANTAVLATGLDFPDALSAASLAGAVDGPLLLVQKNAVPSCVLTRLSALGVTGVYIVGGPSVVSNDVKETLEAAGYNVVRVSGATRYETAAAVAYEVKRLLGSTGGCFVARGDDFADALAASPWAYAAGMPVILTPTGELPASSRAAIAACGSGGVYIVGGDNVVSDSVASAIDALPGIGYPRRLAGATRYETAREVAYAAAGEGPNGLDSPVLGWHEVGLAVATDFPDALAGGAAAGAAEGVLLLTPTSALNNASRGGIAAMKDHVYRITAYGGSNVVSNTAKNAAGTAAQ